MVCAWYVQATIAKYSGMMARFNVDDKGTIMLAAFGPPPAAHEDDAVRAVRCGLDIVEQLEAVGHEVRVGITTGNVYAGSVGNGQRCAVGLRPPPPCSRPQAIQPAVGCPAPCRESRCSGRSHAGHAAASRPSTAGRLVRAVPSQQGVPSSSPMPHAPCPSPNH